MYISLLSVARGHPQPHCENTQVLRGALTEDDDDDHYSAIHGLYGTNASKLVSCYHCNVYTGIG